MQAAVIKCIHNKITSNNIKDTMIIIIITVVAIWMFQMLPPRDGLISDYDVSPIPIRYIKYMNGRGNIFALDLIVSSGGFTRIKLDKFLLNNHKTTSRVRTWLRYRRALIREEKLNFCKPWTISDGTVNWEQWEQICICLHPDYQYITSAIASVWALTAIGLMVLSCRIYSSFMALLQQQSQSPAWSW